MEGIVAGVGARARGLIAKFDEKGKCLLASSCKVYRWQIKEEETNTIVHYGLGFFFI